MPGSTTIPSHIRIGVTGHRRLGDPAAMQALVTHAIDTELHRLFPANLQRDIPVSILSPLAEGADRVVAKAVLSYPGARLDVVLPLALDDYLQDFATTESQAEFNELLSQASDTIYLRTRLLAADCPDPDSRAELRREAYEAAGRYVVDHCDVLLALWDGQPSRGRGGTAEIVQYAHERLRPMVRIWSGAFSVLHRNVS